MTIPFDVTLFAISIEEPAGLDTEMSDSLKSKIPEIANLILEEVQRIKPLLSGS